MTKNILLTAYTGFPSSIQGGPNRIIYEILSNFDSSKFNMRYISKDFDNYFQSNSDIEKHTYDQLSLKKSLSDHLFKRSKLFKKIVSNPLYLKYHYYKNDKTFYKIIERIKKNQSDVVHSHDVRSMYYFLSTPGKKIITIHSKGRIGQDVQDYVTDTNILKKEIEYFERMEKLSLERAGFITFPSIAAKELFFNGNENPYEVKTRIIYNGVNLNRINSITPDNDILKKYNVFPDYDIFILNVADHIKTKNVHFLVEVIKHIKANLKINPLMVNVGKGPETSHLRKLVLQYGLENNIVFLSMIKNEDIISLMKKCDFFLSVGERVVFDMVILEAMASGAKVIALNDGGNKEIIQNGKNGYLLDRLSIPELVNALQTANKEIKFRALETAAKFSTDKMINEYMNLYES